MSNTVDLLIRLAETQARNVLLILHQNLAPSWVIVDQDGRPHIHVTPWASDREKRLAELEIRREMRHHKATAYSFITEAWCAMAPKGWDPDTPLPEKDRAMNQPNRQEVVIALATDGHRTEWRRWFIRRDWNEQVIGLEAASPDGFEAPEGWMTDMLK